MLDLFKKHPLLTCLIIALVLRLFAVVFSKGFMAHDDHFETIRIAYNGIQNGLLNEDGLLNWDRTRPERLGRSPFYVVLLYAIMRGEEAIGIYNLDSMMYLIRFLHALLSLLIVWYGYKYVFMAINNKNYAFLAGLIMAGHFLMPYLSVRNLIEMVSADLLMPAIFLAHKGTRENNCRFLIVSGLLSGLAWIMRFGVALAILPIPFAIWFQNKNIRPAFYYCIGLAFMLLFSGSFDIPFLGGFGRSTFNILRGFLHGDPTLPQPFLMYIPLIFGVFIPPFSLYFLIPAFRKKIISEHLILVSSSLFFFISHSLIANKQERFMIPIFPLLIVLGTIGLYHWLQSNKISVLNKRSFRYSAILAIVVNLILLPVFSLNYAHKGMVEPYVYLSEQDDVKTVLIDRTERRRFIALSYAGYKRPDEIILDKWETLENSHSDSLHLDSVNYFIIYTDINPKRHADSLAKTFGPIKEVFHSTPSTVDMLLHFMNPKHNHTNEAWVYKRISHDINISEDS